MTTTPRIAAAVLAGALAWGATPAVVAAPGSRPVARATDQTVASAASVDARMAARLAKRLRAAALGSDVAVRVYDPVTGRVVFASQSREAQVPASNMKLVTAVNTLTVLDPGTRLSTRVAPGAAAGSIVLVGGGDPLLGSKDLRTLARRTVSALAAAPAGLPARLTLRVDDTLFPAPTRARGWTASYGLGEISPVRALGRHGVASYDTTMDAAAYFATRLRVEGVKVTFAGRGVATSTDTVARVAGHRVADDVARMLRYSDNQVAEVLFRQVALAVGRPATWSGASRAARETLASLGVPTDKLVLVDGSGLSRSDRVTAHTMVALADRASSGTDPRLAAIVPALPVAGRSGTLTHRFGAAPASCARGKVRAKTGFVNGVVALSGVTPGADGRRRVFSIVANHIPSGRYPVSATQRAVDRLAATVTGCW